jgi:hypothetical protein
MWVIVEFDYEGEHFWKDAPPPHMFLSNPHRHIFHFHVAFEVQHDNRAVEILELRRTCIELLERHYLKDGILQFLNMSCEMIATDLRYMVKERYDPVLITMSGASISTYRRPLECKVGVYEDKFVGAMVD